MGGNSHLFPGIFTCARVHHLDQARIAQANGIGSNADRVAPFLMPSARRRVHVAQGRQEGSPEVGKPCDDGAAEGSEWREEELSHGNDDDQQCHSQGQLCPAQRSQHSHWLCLFPETMISRGRRTWDRSFCLICYFFPPERPGI